ncbi:hypothetical protein AB1K84_25355 [Mesobacillus foraminis]|uniref:hypothetical protein n=1 Tax=Mesobacillus foraminis TaxID=279826 RepID=UPI0039A172D0
MKKIVTLLLIILLSVNTQFVFAQAGKSEPIWKKYPDNSKIGFQNADSFYESLDKKQYIEFKNGIINIREKVFFKDVNNVLEKADEYGVTRHGGQGYHPNRQVYVFITVNEDGKKMLTAIFDAETKRLISSSSNFERDRP